MRMWQVEGRPDSMPAEPVWLEVGPDRLDEIARRVRRLSDEELDRFRARHPSVVLGITIDEWTVLFAPDRDVMLLVHGGVEAEILRNDPWNPEARMAIDGHGPLLCAVASSLQGLLERAGIDAELRPTWADDEYDDEDASANDAGPSARTSTIRAWLDLEAPSGPVEILFLGESDLRPRSRTRSAQRAQITTHYHPFLRDVLDPALPRTPLPPIAND